VARFNRRPPSFAATLVALAVIFAIAWMFFLRTGEPASAPVVTGVQGTYTWTPEATGADGVPREEGSFGAVASGDAGGRMTWENTAPRAGSGGATDSAYSAAARRGTTVEERETRTGQRSGATVTIGAWPPVWNVATRSPLDYQGLAAVVRTAVEDGDDAVGIKPVKDGDRVVWRASMRLEGRQVDVVVDQETGVVTWYSSSDGTFTADVDWDSPPAPGTTFGVRVPVGTEVETVTAAPRYAATPAEAGRDAGYDPLVSDLAPDGYRLRAVASWRAELRPADWIGIADRIGSLPVAPPGRSVLQLYARGLSWFTVEQAGPATMRYWQELSDQAAEAASLRLSYQETTLQFGAFKGETALTWYRESGPSLFVAGERRAVFVTGALTRQELLAFAEGLEPVARAE
jgi:hypothetical protein